MTAATAAGDRTRVRLHRLASRADGDGYVVGRVATGEFVAVPAVARRALDLLGEGRTVAEVRAWLRAETGEDVDVAEFVGDLVELGFVAEVDGVVVDGRPAPRASLPWLRPAHVRWLLHAATAVAVAVVVLAAAVAAVLDPGVLPDRGDLLLSDRGGVVILLGAAISWSLIGLHELAHLAAARAAGVPGRIGLGTRLQFLVAQTDVSGVWAAPRRVRLTVYLAGIAVDLLVAAACVLVVAAAQPAGLARRAVLAVALLSLVRVPVQFLVFMRTDVYFVVQDLCGCRDLQADGARYARFLAARARYAVRRRGTPPADPSRALPRRERRAVLAYTPFLLAGTAACLTVAVLVTLPVAAGLVGRAAGTLAGGTHDGGAAFDALVVLGVTGTVTYLWCRAWWRRRRPRARPGNRNPGGGDPTW